MPGLELVSAEGGDNFFTQLPCGGETSVLLEVAQRDLRRGAKFAVDRSWIITKLGKPRLHAFDRRRRQVIAQACGRVGCHSELTCQLDMVYQLLARHAGWFKLVYPLISHDRELRPLARDAVDRTIVHPRRGKFPLHALDDRIVP